MTRYTRTQVENWLGDRGVPTHIGSIKVHGRWGLVRTHDDWNGGWDDEVDCYDLASGSLSAEPWTGISYQDSPFIPYNKAKTDAAMAKVESGYIEAYPEEAYPVLQLCLVATSGDCASGGMGPANEVLLFDAKHNRLVKKYLEAQLAWHITCHLTPTPTYRSGSPNKSHMNKYHNYEKAGYALRDAGIFYHKYHHRTSWEVAYVNELEPRHEPYAIAKAKGQEEN